MISTFGLFIMLDAKKLDFYKENGYVIVDNLIENDKVQLLQDKTSEIIQEIKESFSCNGNQEKKDLRGSQIILKGIPDFKKIVIKRILWAGAAESTFLDTGRDKKLLQIIAQILEFHEADHLINQIHIKEPHDGVEFPWHQDEQNRRFFDNNWNAQGPSCNYVAAITAIDPCTTDNGTIYVIPKSHKLGYLGFSKFLNTEELQNNFMNTQNINVDNVKKALILQPGDTVLIHPHLIHASWPNCSNIQRRVLINGYAYPGANTVQYPGEGSGLRIKLYDEQKINPLIERRIFLENFFQQKLNNLPCNQTANTEPIWKTAADSEVQEGLKHSTKVDGQVNENPHTELPQQFDSSNIIPLNLSSMKI